MAQPMGPLGRSRAGTGSSQGSARGCLLRWTSCRSVYGLAQSLEAEIRLPAVVVAEAEPRRAGRSTTLAAGRGNLVRTQLTTEAF